MDNGNGFPIGKLAGVGRWSLDSTKCEDYEQTSTRTPHMSSWLNAYLGKQIAVYFPYY
jgi:hypothetical protein